MKHLPGYLQFLVAVELLAGPQGCVGIVKESSTWMKQELCLHAHLEHNGNFQASMQGQ